MAAIGFIGLGVMGRPMAEHLVRAGHDVTVHNRSPEPVRALVQAGATAGASPAEVADGADVVITMVPDSPDVEAVVLGDQGVLKGTGEGLLLSDMSSIRPDTARKVAEAAARGVRFLGRPGQLAGNQILERKAPACWRAASTRASASTCTTRIYRSSRPRPATPGWPSR